MNLIPYVFASLLLLTGTPNIVAEGTIPKIEKNFDSEIHRLAVKYKQNEPLARKIIECEGIAYKAKGNNKNVGKNGVVWSTDIGWWQINDYYHKESAYKLGFDINNEWDNLEYGFIVLSEQGTKPWLASKYCWNG